MRVMVIVKATKEAEAEDNPFDVEGAAEIFEAMGKYNEELVKAGIMLAADGLKPSKFGKRVHFNGTKRSVIDGPFAEAKELVAGYTLIQVGSREEALEWARKWPALDADGQAYLEVRQLYEVEDFGDDVFTPELVETYERHRAGNA